MTALLFMMMGPLMVAIKHRLSLMAVMASIIIRVLSFLKNGIIKLWPASAGLFYCVDYTDYKNYSFCACIYVYAI